jgi:hypothetical protein
VIKISPRDKKLQVWLSAEDWGKLEEESKKAGFQNVSDFVRYMTLGEGRKIHSDIKEILDILKKKNGND